MSLEPGTTVDGYKIEAALASGATADVYVVRNADGERFALKLLSINDDELKERLLQEGRILSGLRHPNVLGVHAVVRYAGQPGLVLDYIEGGFTLEDLIGRGLELPQIDALARGIIAGVGAAHKAGVIHRDLKPSNILIAKTPRGGFMAKVSDFGLSKPQAGGVGTTKTGTAMGTPRYMALEQFKDAKHVDHRADIWSIGAILFELVCERPFLKGASLLDAAMELTGEELPRARNIKPELPPRILDALDACLQRDVGARVASCEQLLRMWQGKDPDPPSAVWASFKAPEAGTAPKAGEKTVWEQQQPTVTLKSAAAPAPKAAPAANAGGLPTWVFVAVGVVVLLFVGGAVFSVVAVVASLVLMR